MLDQAQQDPSQVYTMCQQINPTQLQRVVRFSINPSGSMQGSNSYSGKPSSIGLARYYEITLGVEGVPDKDTGYLVGIQEIDEIVRSHLIPIIADRCNVAPETEPATMLPELWAKAQSQTRHTLTRLRWTISPYYWVEMTDPKQHAVLFRQRFDFAAAHRLHTSTMSDEQNRAFFGKCNNPSGHGHNYQLEPCVRAPIETLKTVNVQLDLQNAVNQTLIEKLDHKFLNTDCDWFNQDIGGVIPSVENIARVSYEQLAPVLARLGNGIELVSIQAWETEKTSAIYPG